MAHFDRPVTPWETNPSRGEKTVEINVSGKRIKSKFRIEITVRNQNKPIQLLFNGLDK